MLTLQLAGTRRLSIGRIRIGSMFFAPFLKAHYPASDRSFRSGFRSAGSEVAGNCSPCPSQSRVYLRCINSQACQNANSSALAPCMASPAAAEQDALNFSAATASHKNKSCLVALELGPADRRAFCIIGSTRIPDQTPGHWELLCNHL